MRYQTDEVRLDIEHIFGSMIQSKDMVLQVNPQGPYAKFLTAFQRVGQMPQWPFRAGQCLWIERRTPSYWFRGTPRVWQCHD